MFTITPLAVNSRVMKIVNLFNFSRSCSANKALETKQLQGITNCFKL